MTYEIGTYTCGWNSSSGAGSNHFFVHFQTKNQKSMGWTKMSTTGTIICFMAMFAIAIISVSIKIYLKQVIVKITFTICWLNYMFFFTTGPFRNVATFLQTLRMAATPSITSTERQQQRQRILDLGNELHHQSRLQQLSRTQILVRCRRRM